VTLFLLVAIFLLTDRRKAHHERMRGLALDDGTGGDDHER